MLSPLFLTMLVACEQVTPTGNPLEPVVIAEAPAASTLPAEEEAESAEDTEEAPFSISSEELAAIADGQDPAVEPDTAPEAEAEAEAAAEPPSVAPTPAPEATPQPAPVAAGWPQTVGTAWPVRLVTTIPNASPPRAILGLPNGTEVVVNPGSMVPDLGLVVVAISPGSAELAKIAPAGDHATIESITLRSQY